MASTTAPPGRQDATPRDAGLGVWEAEGGHLKRDVGGRAPRWVAAVPLAELPDDSAVHLELAGLPVCLARSSGAVHALLDRCSHGQVALSDGEVEDGLVQCWLHGSCFDLTTGRPTGLPATAPVPVYPVRITAGVIEVAVPTPASPISSIPASPALARSAPASRSRRRPA